MANFINVSGITYCGKEAQEIFSKDIYDIDLRQYGITFMDGVKGKMKMYTGEIGDAWQLYTCPFTPQGAASLAEAFIEPAAIKVNQENCYDTFWNTFLVEQTTISLNGGIPQTFGDWFFEKYRAKMKREYEEGTWITDDMEEAYARLHKKGFAMAVESEVDGVIAGGLYGVILGKNFFGESMYSDQENGSKLALVLLAQRMQKSQASSPRVPPPLKVRYTTERLLLIRDERPAGIPSLRRCLTVSYGSSSRLALT
jgi:hypothetical protein